MCIGSAWKLGLFSFKSVGDFLLMTSIEARLNIFDSGSCLWKAYIGLGEVTIISCCFFRPALFSAKTLCVCDGKWGFPLNEFSLHIMPASPNNVLSFILGNQNSFPLPFWLL